MHIINDTEQYSIIAWPACIAFQAISLACFPDLQFTDVFAMFPTRQELARQGAKFWLEHSLHF